MTNIKQTLTSVKKVRLSKELKSLVCEFIAEMNLSWELELKDDELENQACLIQLCGSRDEPVLSGRKKKFGFEISIKGRGHILLPDKKYLFSYLTHLFLDCGEETIDDNGCKKIFSLAFEQLRTAYDYFLTQEGRVSSGLNRESYIRNLAKQAVTHVEVNGLAYPMGLETGVKGETYPMFYTYCPALDQFVYSSLNKGLYPNYYLSANLNYLKQNAKWVTEKGLVPGLMCFEPRSVPEEFFSQYPMLRGARVDHPFRSFKPRYNMTITHPAVINHYKEMVRKLLTEVPELGFLTIWTNDSGAGFEHTKSLYVGRNGGAYLVREWKDDAEIARLAGNNALNFLQSLLEAGREINPEFRVVTRLESFYGEHDIIWNGLGDGLDVETASLAAKGWDMPYSHPVYEDSHMLNGGSAHHQGFDKIETDKILESRERGVKSAFYFGMGPEVLFAPLMGIPYPKLVWKRLQTLKEGQVRDLVVYGGTFPPEQVPYFVNYEILRRFQYGHDQDINSVLYSIARKWTKGDSPDELLQAWDEVEQGILNFPNVSGLYNTIGFAWYRLWTRPLVPNIEAIPQNEKDYYEDMMCTTPHNPNNVDLARDVLFDISSFEHCEKALPRIDAEVWKHLDKAILILTEAVERKSDKSGKGGILYDQLIRIKALKNWIMTHRNIAAWITGVHGYIRSTEDSDRKKYRALLDEMIASEISNMEELLLLFDSDISFIALMKNGESPLMYGENIQDQIRTKIALMKKYGKLDPYIDPDYMVKKAGMKI